MTAILIWFPHNNFTTTFGGMKIDQNVEKEEN